jgi:hypothetical protein
MDKVNDQRARRQNFDDAKSGSSEFGQYADGVGGKPSVTLTNDGEAVSPASFPEADGMLGAEPDNDLEAASSPEFGVYKGTDQPTAPALERGQQDVPEPDSVSLKGRGR